MIVLHSYLQPQFKNELFHILHINVVNVSFDHFNLLAEKFPKLISQLKKMLMRRKCIVLTFLAQRIYNTEKSFRVSRTAPMTSE